MNLLNFLNENKTQERSLEDLNKPIKDLVKFEDGFVDKPLPIHIKKSEWEVLESPTRLSRVFIFENPKEVLYFTNELYKYQFKINHHAKMTVENLEVVVETYTHDIDDITHQDLKIQKMANQLYEDINYFLEEE